MKRNTPYNTRSRFRLPDQRYRDIVDQNLQRAPERAAPRRPDVVPITTPPRLHTRPVPPRLSRRSHHHRRRPRIRVTDVDDSPVRVMDFSPPESPPLQRRVQWPTTLVDQGAAAAAAAASSDEEDLTLNQSNFYILPLEVIKFLDNHPELYSRDMINLRAVGDLYSQWKSGSHAFQTFWRGVRTDPSFSNEEFIHNEFMKMFAGPRYTRSRKRGWLFPNLIGANDTVLSIPGKDVFDLPVFLLLFILKRLSQFPRGRNASFSIGYNLGLEGDTTTYPIMDENGHPVRVIDGKISEESLRDIYMAIIRRYANLLPGNESEATWNGSEDSGTRIALHNYGQTHRLRLRLILTPTTSVSYAHGWTQQVEDLLKESVGSSVMSVRNRDDNKCLLYCLVIGLITKMTPNGSRVFGLSTMMVESTEVYAKGMIMFANSDDEVSVAIRRLTKFLMPIQYSSGPVDPLYDYLKDIDLKAGTMMSVTEFRKEFGELEEKVFPDNLCGIDVYALDFNVNRHIYPLYVSKNRERVIELLCVTPLDTRCSHYCVIMNMEKLLRGTGGKQFFSCSKCGQCFYHRRLLRDHKCPATEDHHNVDGEGGYHYSNKNIVPEEDVVVGSCSKCRLSFTDEFKFEYHKEHCFMQGQTGYRHVQLVTYNIDEHPCLNGEEIDMELEEKHVARRRVMYADFESSIDEETGEHKFMSYGVYDWKNDVYRCGYDLQEFIDFVLDIAYGGDEDQIYVYFHNAMGYDANFILRHILKQPEYATWGIQVIMKSTNRLQKLVLHTRRDDKSRAIHIGDTFLFLTLSLERIVGSIRKDDLELNKENFSRFFEVFSRQYPDVEDEEIGHILRKNIFPYKFFTDATKLDTPINAFLNVFEPKEENLRFFGERVTLQDLRDGYPDTKHVIEIFGCKDARDYHDLYLCCDVMQLADVFERSMHILWESHHIHLTKYLGMPSASWAAFLRHDPSMSIPLYEDTFFAEFFKGMIRGGITSAALRHAVADDRHSIIYLDVNGLYPYVMQAYNFPCGHFEFIPLGWSQELSLVKLYEYFEMFEREHKGMCFCVDLSIPDAVKELTDMYPFAPEHRRIYKEYYSDFDKKELTPFLKKWSEANNGEKMSEFTGLVCTLYDKEKYNVHWRVLRFYLQHGVIVRKVWFGVMFDEGDYLAGYIRKNIEIRNTRKDELGKTLYKLLGNSIYGKTFESPFKRNTYEIVRNPVKLQGLLEEGNIAAMTPIDDLGWIVRMDGEDIVLDKPTYIGACVCEFAKLHMYTLLYDKLMKIFPKSSSDPDDPGCQMVYTDTDSFIVRVRHPEGVGTTPAELFAYIKSQDPTLIGGIGGQVKSETGEDDTIQEVIALRSKVYAYMTKKGHIGKRAKGTTHDAQEMQLDWNAYKEALQSLTSIDTRNVQFVRKTFKIASLDVYRQSLSVNDGKRFICEDGVHTHAFGYPNS